ncbi:MAG: hypothetical protein MJ116_14160 [Lachnospiraceae bacterium]|nr:hypothetical protein [Lachnospiraceae bacterium]
MSNHGLSLVEKETILLFNEGEKEASLFTYNKALIRRMNDLCQNYPDEVHLDRGNGADGYFYTLPKKWFKIEPPRIPSEAQLASLKRMREKKAELQNQKEERD